jgi:hypothetical protein
MDDCPICRFDRSALGLPSSAPRPVQADEWDHDDRIHGLFLGMAIGDGIGALLHRGDAVPTAPEPGSLTTGGATSLGLFTTDGLVRMAVRYDLKGIGPAWDLIRHALRRWAVLQTAGAGATTAGPVGGWLMRQHVLHRAVDGFGATVAAVKSDVDVYSGFEERREPRNRVNQSTGAGALVRVASAGAIFSPAVALLVGSVAAAYTHGAPEAYLSGGALARIVSSLITGASTQEAVGETLEELASWPGSAGVTRALQRPAEVDGGRAVRSLATGVAAALGTDETDPVAVIVRSARAGGTAAAIVTGAIVGARNGAIAMPAAWRSAPDAVATIEEMATTVSVAHRAYVMVRRLPGWEPESDSPFEGHPVSRWLSERS